MSVHIYQTMCQESHVQCCTWSTRGCIRASKRSLLTNPWPLSCWNTLYSVCKTYWSNSCADSSSYSSPSVPLSRNLHTLVRSNSADIFWTSRPANSTNSPFRLSAILLDSLQNRTATQWLQPPNFLFQFTVLQKVASIKWSEVHTKFHKQTNKQTS